MITDYDSLVKEVIDWLHRDDLNTKVPLFIGIAEEQIYSNPDVPLMIRSLETISTQITDSRFIDLPQGFEKARSIRLNLSYVHEIRFQAPEQMIKLPTTGVPNYFTIIGNQIEFDRVPDDEYDIEIQYFKKANPLSNTNQTNEVLTSHPYIYLYGALSVGFAHAQDTEQQFKYSQMFLDAIRGANKADKKARYGTAPAMSTEYPTV